MIAFLAKEWSEYNHAHDVNGLCGKVLASVRLWGQDLNKMPGLAEQVVEHLDVIVQRGAMAAMERVLGRED